MHFSKLSEDFIIWASRAFEFIKFPDSLCTGSSIMPQKKNPDAAELIRSKTEGFLVHSLIYLLFKKAYQVDIVKIYRKIKNRLSMHIIH